jgi:hypothetical protein
MNRSTTYAVALFAGLAIVAAVLLFAASSTTDSFAHAVLIEMGSVVFGSGLTIFLLRLLATTDRA